MLDQPGRSAVDPAQVLAAVPVAVLVVGSDERLRFANSAAEQFLDSSAAQLIGVKLGALFGADSPVVAIARQALAGMNTVTEDGIGVESPRLGARFVTIKVAPLGENGDVVVAIHERSIARKMDRQLVHRHAARSVTAMAAILAHEVKNPLSGIRGAAQLIEPSLAEEDRELTRLIVDETDRICALVDRMEVFSDRAPASRKAVNIHQVLEYVRKIARTGFARDVRFTELYDPSLPPVLGDRDQLIQAFLNLVKNAAEAVPERGGEVVLSTAYRHGIRMAIPGSFSRVELPLVVAIQDNGVGIPEDLRSHLFDPFVTTKVNGTGLGLALVAKVVGDHGGLIEFDSEPGRTVFHVMLPIAAPTVADSE
jgi:two-component system nitrogen regulation sensor histidine kinase GlnL